MKKNISYLIGGICLMAGATVFTGCQDDFDNPVIEAPVATLQPNMTIFELKQMYWDDATNYIDTIGIENGQDDGKSYVIHGRVVSSDEAGNVFKSLIIQDETAALALSINSYNLYLKYRMGQEVVLDLKGMYIGKYNGLVQLGMPEWYEAGNAWEATFMAPEFFEQHVQLNGFPDIAKVDTLEINSFSDLPSNPDGLCRYQSRLVKFNNVSFQNGGEQQFSEYHSSGVNQNIVDANGATLPVRTSGYSNFWNKYLPKGNGDVVCILSYYGSTGWQLMLNDYEGCMNFGNPTLSPGAESNPYTVAEAVSAIAEGKTRSGWVSGYIVGAVAPEVAEVTGNDDIEWSADVVLDNTLVIGATPDTKDISQALVISLPAGSLLRQYGNLADNPDNYKKAISVKGTFGKYMGTYGVLDNSGSASQFKIEGVEVVDPSVGGSGTETAPYTVADVIGGATGTDVWTKGYIVGWVDGMTLSSGATFNADATANTNILLAASPDVTDVGQCLPVQLPGGAVRSALNLQDNPGNYKRAVMLKGSLEKYFGAPGIKSVTAYTFDGAAPENPGTPDTPSGDAKGSGTASDPYNVAKALQVAVANGETSDVSVYTEGYVISGSIDTQYGNGTWVIADNAAGTGSTITVYRAKDFNNEKFTDANKVKVGDKIVVYAPIINFKGNTPETNYGYLYSINGNTSGGSTTPDQPGDVTGAGTEASPYTVSDVIGGATGTGVWTKGYIVGWVDGMTLSSGATFNADATANTNILLAASPDVTDVSKCVPVQLPAGDVRSALNLQANPGNYKRAVMLKGSLEKYFGAPGIKSVTAYTFDGAAPENPGTPDTPSGEAKGSGTASDPYNVAKALQVAVANGETSDVSVYTEGYVISGSIDTQYGNGTWVIADNAAGTGSTITVYRAKDFNNEKFTDANKVKVGDKIVVYAPIINYKGNTPETNYGYLYSINGNTSGGSTTPDTPDQPDQPGDVTGAGTEASPYTVADVQNGATGTAWVKGYIVGWVDGMTLSSGATFNADATAATNLLIADSPDVTDAGKCVPVQLPAGDVRTALNLQDNPGNYKKCVLLQGSLERYFGTAGVKSVKSYKFVD